MPLEYQERTILEWKIVNGLIDSKALEKEANKKKRKK